MRKLLFLFTFIIVFSLFAPLTVSALPDNDYDSTYRFRYIEFVGDTITPYAEPPYDFSFGDLYYLRFFNASDSTGYLRAHINLTIDISSPADFFYLKSWNIGSTSYSFQVTSFSSTSGSLSLSDFDIADPIYYSGSVNEFSFNADGSEYLIDGPYPINVSGSLTFAGYAAIPAGQYLVTLRVSVNSPSFNIPMGFFLDYHLTGDPVVDFENGELDFSQAASDIYDDLSLILSSPTTPDATKQFNILLANYKLDQLRSASDAKFSHVVDSFESTSNDLVNSYILSGSTDVLPAVSQLNILYTDALTQAVTPEQGTLINTRYNLRLSQMQTIFDVNYKKELDDVLSDQDFSEKQDAMNHTDELLEIESSALAIFEESEYQSYLTFVDWFHNLEDDPTVYRSIFEFLFEDSRASVVQPFLIIPFSLVLVGVILATTTVVLKRGGRDG